MCVQIKSREALEGTWLSFLPVLCVILISCQEGKEVVLKRKEKYIFSF